VRREHVNDPVNRLSRRIGVQGREGKMARLGDGERGLDRFEITHLTDENDVRILAERVLEGACERLGISSHFALIDQAALMLVDELDRVFDSDDVAFPLPVDLVDQRREGGRLSRPGWPGDQHQSAWLLRHFRYRGGQPQILKRADGERNLSNYHRDASALTETVTAEPGEAGDPEREIEFVLHLEPLLLILSQN